MLDNNNVNIAYIPFFNTLRLPHLSAHFPFDLFWLCNKGICFNPVPKALPRSE